MKKRTDYIYDMAQFEINHDALDKALQAAQAGATERIVTADDIRDELDDTERCVDADDIKNLHVCCCPRANINRNMNCRNIPEEIFVEAVYTDGTWKITKIYRDTIKCEASIYGNFMTLGGAQV